MKKFIWFIIIILLVWAAYAWWQRDNTSGSNSNPGSTTTNATSSNSNTVTTYKDLIRVSTPLQNQVVTSPLTIRGEARGNWYFEASFPVKIVDGNGNLLGQYHAEAQGDWMTTDYVPFQATLSFTPPTTPTGTLILEKDNPSGLPQNADELRIPIRFDTTASNATTRLVKLYYYNQAKDKNASGNILCSSQGLEAVERQIPTSITPIQDTIRALMRGELSATERARGLSTEFPLSGLTLQAASLSGGTLTLTFSDPQNKTSGGACRVSILRAEIETTAKQFSGVNQVRLAPEELFQP